MGRTDRSQTSLENETRVILKAREGDRDAQAQLVEFYWDRLYRWLYQLTKDRHLAEDLTQESFLKAFKGLHSFRIRTRFTPWLFRIGYNCFVNHWRKARARESLPEYLTSNLPDPVRNLLDQETRDEVRKAIDALPEDWRAAVLLRIEQDLSFKEIAEALRTTEETARWRVFKARQKMLQTLRAYQEQENT